MVKGRWRLMFDKDDQKHLEEYVQQRIYLKNRVQTMDHLIADLEHKKGLEVGKNMRNNTKNPAFYKGRLNKIPTDAEVMNED